MDVMTGYKQTEVGLIPQDWNAVELSILGTFKNGINKGGEAFGHGSPFVNLMDVFGVSSIDSSNSLGLVDTSDAEQQTYNLLNGDVLFIRSSVKPSGVGLTAVVDDDLPKTVYSGFLIRFRDNGALDLAFKRHCFYEEDFRSRVINASSVSANTNINQNNLKRIILALPSNKAEQEAIAEALSDADALIESLEQLLVKKRNIKQGAMQELLTGKRRLPGFNEEWEETAFGDVVNIRNEKVNTRGTPLAEFCIELEQIGQGTGYVEEFVDARSRDTSKYKFLSNDVLFGRLRPYLRKYWFAHRDGVCSTEIWPLTPSGEEILEGFLYQVVQTEVFIDAASAAYGTHMPRADWVMLSKHVFNLPTDVKEQAAIAATLSDLDKEIIKLEAKLEKLRQIKQGMMQELLTGRIRLV
jgi:type I restriction enzyme, S subunit